MTSVPAILEPPVVDVDDATLFNGAASVWAVINFAADLPATPEKKAALSNARSVFLHELAAFDLTRDDLDRYLVGFRLACNGRAGPPGV